MKVIILSGISGSGKSTLAKKLNLKTVSADDFRIVNNQYIFDSRDNKRCHDSCLKLFLESLPSDIVVDNTNTQVWEIAPYYRLAEIFNLDVQIVRIYVDPIIAYKRNTHNVPFDTILKQYKNFNETLPSFWNTKTILSEEI